MQNHAIFAVDDSVKLADVTVENNISLELCTNVKDIKVLRNGWFLWEPYQFNQVTDRGYTLTGMDIELTRAIAERIGVEIKYASVTWDWHQRDLEYGRRDIASGATYTEARTRYAYFSVPYRFEENSLFVLKNNNKILNFNDISECLAQIRLQNFRLGVIKGFIYADSAINEFIADETNNDIVINYENDAESLSALLRSEIDGFIADRIVGASMILHRSVDRKIKEVSLYAKKTPVHFMFSKKTVPLDLVDRFNQEIKSFINSSEYKHIIKQYLYPVLLLQIIDSQWFYALGVIGTIAFAIAGISIAVKDNLTLFGTLLLAMLPSVGGSVMRDVMLNRETVGIILTPSYMYYIFVLVLIGFATVKLLQHYNTGANSDPVVQNFWSKVFILSDAIGQSTFVVIGVSVVVMTRIEPIILWGPFFAFITSNAGVILRDLLRDQVVSCIKPGIGAEVSVLWGIVFSVFLDVNAHNPDSVMTKYAVIGVCIGALVTHLAVYYFQIPNIRFRQS